MEETKYKAWWGLHLRLARGETLSTQEQAAYQAGIAELDREERITGDLAALRRMRTSIAELEAENARLHEKRRLLDTKIAAIEAVLSEETRQQLGMGAG